MTIQLSGLWGALTVVLAVVLLAVTFWSGWYWRGTVEIARQSHRQTSLDRQADVPSPEPVPLERRPVPHPRPQAVEDPPTEVIDLPMPQLDLPPVPSSEPGRHSWEGRWPDLPRPEGYR